MEWTMKHRVDARAVYEIKWKREKVKVKEKKNRRRSARKRIEPLRRSKALS
jgi:hypothetical protein